LSASYFVRHGSSVTEQQRLQQMIDELRRMRERCEPKSNQNPPVPPLPACSPSSPPNLPPTAQVQSPERSPEVNHQLGDRV